MRIAIITLPLHTNYGGILQAYALQTVLQKMGHEVVLLDQSPYRSLSWWRKPLSYTKRAINKFLFCDDSKIFIEKYHNVVYPIISQFTQKFIDKYINRIEVDNLANLKKGLFDAIVVGSDQIWRPLYYPKITNAYLSFTTSWNIKRIAYAPSFGTDQWEYTYRQTKSCAKALRKFNAVSVREDSGVGLCEKYLGVKVEHVLDPTMLLEVETYIQIIRETNLPKNTGTLLCYVLDDMKEKQEIIKKISEIKELVPFRVNSKVEDYNAPLKERIQPSVEQWLNGFYNAQFIITDSFHATVFSILFGKPFIVVGNKERGISRLESLLDMFGLEKHLVLIGEEVNLNMDFNLDTQRIYSILNKMRSKSINFLSEYLNN